MNHKWSINEKLPQNDFCHLRSRPWKNSLVKMDRKRMEKMAMLPGR